MRSLTKSMKRTPDSAVTTCAPTAYIYPRSPTLISLRRNRLWGADLVVIQKLFAKLARGTQVS
jgi:hypothetical protein